jgi:cellulose 1,4-beta-cellobiosidase
MAESSSSILISWTAPSSGGTPAYYNIWRSSSANGTYIEIDFVFAPDTSYTDTGLNPSTTYYYKVDAENTYQERGSQSSYASATTQPLDETSVPSAPTGVTATAQYGGIQVMWNAVPGATSYNVYAKDPNSLIRFNLRATPTTPGYLDAYVEAGETQYYEVTAVNDAGESEPSVIVSATIARAAPDTPSNLRGSNTTGSSIRITWDASPNATGYKLYRSKSSSGPFSQVYSGATTEYNNTNLSKGTSYYFRVTAYNSAGESQPSRVLAWGTFNF